MLLDVMSPQENYNPNLLLDILRSKMLLKNDAQCRYRSS